MDTLAFLVGVSLTAWVITMPVVGYMLWHYVYKPWKVVRLDQAGLRVLVEEQNKSIAAVIELAKLHTVDGLTDAELAVREERHNQRAAMRRGAR